jgi:hypothetical protein
MSVEAQNGPRLSPIWRILCAFAAVLIFLDMWQWSHGSRLQVAGGLAGALAWGSLAYYGNRPGWSRYVTLVLLLIYAVLAMRHLTGAWV